MDNKDKIIKDLLELIRRLIHASHELIQAILGPADRLFKAMDTLRHLVAEIEKSELLQ